MDGKKILMEETSGKDFRRLLIEQGTSEDDNDVDYVHNLKQGAAKGTILFVNGALETIVPALVVALIIVAAVVYFIFG